MLQRNLLYTAVTRAKRLVVLVGSRKAIGQAVRTVSAGRRCTALDFRLAGSRLPDRNDRSNESRRSQSTSGTGVKAAG
jgi:exodeoxyribonuclease V alpha subunit